VKIVKDTGVENIANIGAAFSKKSSKIINVGESNDRRYKVQSNKENKTTG